jgi:4-alpha-glucanotransferase
VVRSSGILLHPTSLPSPFGIGDLGPEAFKVIVFDHGYADQFKDKILARARAFTFLSHT